jgi:hypothetical protein
VLGSNHGWNIGYTDWGFLRLGHDRFLPNAFQFISHSTIRCYRSVPGGKVNILGGHSIGHSKKKSLYEHVFYSELFPIFGAQYFLSLPLYAQSQQPTDASHRFTCFRHWRITAGGKENIARRIQNTGRQLSQTVRNRTHVHIRFFS